MSPDRDQCGRAVCSIRVARAGALDLMAHLASVGAATMTTQRAQSVLVTGGAGFLGMRLVRRLRQRGRRVVVLDDGSAGTLTRLAEFRDDPEVTWSAVDIRDRARMRSVVGWANPAAVAHLAALHFIPGCERAPGTTLEVNVTGTRNLLDCLPRTTRLLLASTAAVYAPSVRRHREDDRPGPVEVYGRSKLAAEQLVHARGGADRIVARLVNLYGTGDPHPHLIPEILRQAKRGDHLELGALDESRDYLHVDDATDAITRLLLDGPAGIYNVGTGRATPGARVLEIVGKLSGRALVAELDPTRARATSRPRCAVDTARLTRTLPGWAPRRLDEGLAELITTPSCRRAS
jgi:UDP-glucose 4-epimerase